MPTPILCFLGAGFSSVAGVPLAKDLFRSSHVLALSDRSRERFPAVIDDFRSWEACNPNAHPEQYLSDVYCGVRQNAPPWDWVVEYVGVAIASPGTPSASQNRNPRYSNRINRPSKCSAHAGFFRALLNTTEDLKIITTNYDLLIERCLRHKKMIRPPSPGCHYGGLPHPQELSGQAQPFSKWYEKLIEMAGTIPVYKLHGSLNWSLSNDGTIVAYQDMRPAFRHGGNAAIVPPISEKLTPNWLTPVWEGAGKALRECAVWVVCGYSAPTYDIEVMKLLRSNGTNRPLKVLLVSPDSDARASHWRNVFSHASVVPLPGLPSGIRDMEEHLAD